MKLNERLFELRRKAGLSQEELADKVGVSRQAVGKWENGTSVPELDKLLTLAEVYGLPIGELLGVESAAVPADAAEAKSGAADDGALEDLLRGLTEDQKAAEERAVRRRRRLWWTLGAAGAAVVVVVAVLGVRISDLRERLSSLDARVAVSNSRLSNQIYALQNSLREMLAEQNSLFSDWSAETLAFDPESREVTVRLFARPKSVTEGMRLDFIVTDEEGRELQTEAIRQGTGFAAELRLPQPGHEIPLEALFAGRFEQAAVSSQVIAPDPLDGSFTLTAVLTEGDTTATEELGTFYAGLSELVGDFRAAWYPTAAGESGLLAVYADAGREIVSAELVTFVNGVERTRTPLDMSRDADWFTEFDMPEKYTVPRQEGNVTAAAPGKLTAGAANRLFVRELAPDVPESREGETVSVLLELTDDQNITYAALIFITSAGARPQNTSAAMTPILK